MILKHRVRCEPMNMYRDGNRPRIGRDPGSYQLFAVADAFWPSFPTNKKEARGRRRTHLVQFGKYAV